MVHGELLRKFTKILEYLRKCTKICENLIRKYANICEIIGKCTKICENVRNLIFRVIFMAKNLLSKKAIKYIVQLRNDEDVRYSYTQIAKLVEENFGVKVCFQTIAYHYKHNKDIDTSSLSQVKPKSKLAELVEQRKAEKSASQITSQPAPKPVQKPYRPSNSLLDENGEEPEWMKIANMSIPEFKEYKAKKAAEQAAKKAAEQAKGSDATDVRQ